MTQWHPLILIIDDDPVARMQLRLCLEDQGYSIVEAQDGEEGLSIYNQLHPDMVLLDALMPGLNGFECCIQLQSLPRGDQIPILMITGLDDQESVDRAFAVGAADYVTKPVHWAVLRQRVKRLIQQTQLQQKLEAANRELQRLALLDGLTQVANRRQFDELLNHQWQKLQETRQPLSLLLCDIDYFKSYNDTYGHQAGDRCLQKVAQAIQAALDSADHLVARYGGEEFAVLLPEVDPRAALFIAQQVRANLARLAIPHLNSRVNSYVTFSTGLASLIPNSEMTPDQLITLADQALYQAKHQGRNRCCVYLPFRRNWLPPLERSDRRTVVEDIKCYQSS